MSLCPPTPAGGGMQIPGPSLAGKLLAVDAGTAGFRECRNVLPNILYVRVSSGGAAGLGRQAAVMDLENWIPAGY